ncbi:hypothetical protein FW781_18280 [Chryseobacterium panacisoli]|uniref:Uncharacterized protein n=1 Tax=Chryseobacterium panacisoli TaxID=1807141 RepID=A0A5D8ZI13_9FLAO|nr:hypothetical protein [Chryseobacterium panacisoli]TZF93642.1 hypothetical protein FW781_18280 [Chryseobacterium panacisoli]
MNRENLKESINICITNLFQLVKINCRNSVSPNLFFILSDCNEFESSNASEQRVFRHRINNSKTLLTLDAVLDVLQKEFDDLYDVTLYVFRATRRETIIEIQYYRKSNFDADYFSVVKDNLPRFHSKIAMPVYAWEEEKFDVNWESGGGMHHMWKTFLWRNFLYRRRIKNLKR